MYVQDLGLFVTLQLLEAMPAVPSLGKLCSEHGCSHEWKNGETPRLTKNGKTITRKMYNFVPLVVPGLSSSSSSSSASTSRPKDQSNFSAESEISSDPVTTRSAKHACGKPVQTNPDKRAWGNRGSAHKEDEMNEEDPTQGIPDWLQPFTEIWKTWRCMCPQIPLKERSHIRKVVIQKRKHNIYTHFAKDRNCHICLRTQITRVSCRRRDEGSITSRKTW